MCDSIHFIIKQLTVIRQRHDDAALFVEHRFAARPEFQLLQTVKTFPRRAAEIPPEPNLAVLRAATMPPRGPVMPRDAGTTTPSAPTCSILLLFLLPAPNLGTGRGRRGSRRRAARARRRGITPSCPWRRKRVGSRGAGASYAACVLPAWRPGWHVPSPSSADDSLARAPRSSSSCCLRRADS